jgi:hypothetical protein
MNYSPFNTLDSMTIHPTNKNITKHNNMQRHQTLRQEVSNDVKVDFKKLDLFTGINEVKQNKVELEQDKLFKKTPGLSNPFGMASQVYPLERYNENLSRTQKGIVPFQQYRERPGLGLDYHDGGDVGFHDSFRVKPKNVVTLRAKNSEKRVLNEGVVAPAGMMGYSQENRSNVFKNKPETTFNRTSADLFTTTGIEKGSTCRDNYHLKEDNLRNMTLKSYMGHASSNTHKNNYVCMEEVSNKKQQLKGDQVSNFVGKNKQITNKESYKLSNNNRTSSNRTELTNLTGSKSFPSKSVNNMKKTTRETTENNSVLGNLLSNVASYVYDTSEQLATTIRNTLSSEPLTNVKSKVSSQKLHQDDKPHITIRNTTNKNQVTNIIGRDHKSYVSNNDNSSPTTRNTLSNINNDLNLKSRIKNKHVTFSDIAKTTSKQQIIGKLVNNNMQNQKGIAVKPHHDFKVTTREINEDESQIINLNSQKNSSGNTRHSDQAKVTTRETGDDFDILNIGTTENMALTVGPTDEFKITTRNMLNQDEILNVQRSDYGNVTQISDKPKITTRNTSTNNEDVINLVSENQGYYIDNQDNCRITVKQQTIVNNSDITNINNQKLGNNRNKYTAPVTIKQQTENKKQNGTLYKNIGYGYKIKKVNAPNTLRQQTEKNRYVAPLSNEQGHVTHNDRAKVTMKQLTENSKEGSNVKGINKEYNKKSYDAVNICSNRQKVSEGRIGNMASNYPVCKNFINVSSKNKKISGVKNYRNPASTKIYQNPLSITQRTKIFDNSHYKKNNRTFLLKVDNCVQNKNVLQ